MPTTTLLPVNVVDCGNPILKKLPLVVPTAPSLSISKYEPPATVVVLGVPKYLPKSVVAGKAVEYVVEKSASYNCPAVIG